MIEIAGYEISGSLFSYAVLPLFIFFARICDVSIGTIRIIMIGRSRRGMAALLGFFEVIIWLIAVSQVLGHLNNVISYIAYGAGFAAGNYVGISIENRLALGMQAVQIITEENLKALSMLLRQEGFGVTNLAAKGQKGQMDFIYVVTPRRRSDEVLAIVKEFDPNAFISVMDLRSSYAGFVDGHKPNSISGLFRK
jgi:uncharacterized protein YebE (UPF0316 family)